MPGEDPVTEYLLTLQPSLTREAEVDVCRRIERAKRLIRQSISQSSEVHKAAAALAAEVLSFARKVSEVVDLDPAGYHDVDDARHLLAEVDRCYEREQASSGKSQRAVDDTSRAIEAIRFRETHRLEFIQLIEQSASEQEIGRFIRVEEQELKRAEKELLEGNLRLVVELAKEHVRGGGRLAMQLVPVGNIALMHAISTFDYQHGGKFASYATWWIRQGFSHAVFSGFSRTETTSGIMEGLIEFPGGTRWVN